jgi:tetratricopeptide (TPR) repeat protein
MARTPPNIDVKQLKDLYPALGKVGPLPKMEQWKDRVLVEPVDRSMKKADEAFDTKRYASAITHYSKAIAQMEKDHKEAPVLHRASSGNTVDISGIDPRLADAYFSRAAAYKNTGSKKQALADYRKVFLLTSNPQDRVEAEQRIKELSTPHLQPSNAPRNPTLGPSMDPRA